MFLSHPARCAAHKDDRASPLGISLSGCFNCNTLVVLFQLQYNNLLLGFRYGSSILERSMTMIKWPSFAHRVFDSLDRNQRLRYAAE